ncbi:SMP-30/gluconolactonase/LRE family protein [Niabella sp. CJ426]|uniref:SMP-30/gluconolactonase/LRE family protein n=1 Tax=Niabella sp. CJ426 TaxID=3393740 RepID=UPI003D08797C
MTIQKVIDLNCKLGESPVWDAERSAICWVDITGQAIHEFNTASGRQHTFLMEQAVGCIALCDNGDFLAALKDEVVRIDRLTGAVQSVIAGPERRLVTNRSNDGKCDAKGRFWFGTKSLSDEPRAGNVYCVADGVCSLQIQDVTISNGIAWSDDYRTMYYIDTPTFGVVAYDYDLNNGSISNKRTVIEIAEEEGFPDGMTIDTEGMLWIAHWGGFQVARWDPSTGTKLSSIQLPVANVTSCVFGGAAHEDLYITTARTEMSSGNDSIRSDEGCLFVAVNSGFKGLPANRFSIKNTEK